MDFETQAGGGNGGAGSPQRIALICEERRTATEVVRVRPANQSNLY